MAKNKFYAVAQGRKPGIYNEWFGAHGAEVQIKGFAGAVFKGFAARHEAEAFIAKASSKGAPSQTSMPWEPAVKDSPPKARARAHAKPSSKEHATHHAIPEGNRIEIYSDGGCSRNPGPGGYGVVILHDGKRTELSGGYALTTNNRMELMGCIKALESLKGASPVTLHTDSQYVVNGIEKGWARRWKENNWMRTARDRAENSDLWELLLKLCDRHDARFKWVRGHVGNIENERCDRLAVAMTQESDLPPDSGYGKK